MVKLIIGRRTKYLVVAIWLGLVVGSAAFAGRLGDVQATGADSARPAGAESTRVAMLRQASAPAGALPAVVVYERPSGLTAADRAKVDADAAAFGRQADLGGPVPEPVLAADGQAAQLVIPLDLSTDATEAVDSINAVARRDAGGLAVHVTGPAGATADQARAIAGIDGTLLLATAAVVVLILLVTYRSPTLWLLPLAAVGVALTVAQALIYLLARYADLTVTADGSAILTILVFGAGTDYALLLIARYREELRRHTDRHAAMAVALRRCAPAVIASALTVAAGVLCLLVADLNATRGLGPVLAVGVVVALVVLLTLFPALLVIAGRWIFWPVRPTVRAGRTGAAPGGWARFGTAVARRPRLIWVSTTLVLATLSAGVLQLGPTGLTAAESFRGRHDSTAGAEALARHFPAGAGRPVVAVSRPEHAAQVRAAFTTTPGLDAGSVTGPVLRGGHAYLEGTLTDPADSAAAHATVDRLRAAVRAVPEAWIGGDTATELDVQRAARRDRYVIVPLVLVVVFLILVVLLRGLVAPLVLTATVVLSFGAALGVSALVFRHVFGFAGTDSSYPLFVLVFLVSLGVDYNIFLMTRIREETRRHGTRRATVLGLSATGGVITSAGLVLAGTFAVLVTLPLTQFVELGFAVAAGILLDTFIVRSVLVPALTVDLGRHMWWPGRDAATRSE